MASYDDVKQAAETIRSRVPHVPEIAIVLGSGLGDFAGTLTDAVSMPYAKLPHWPVFNVADAAITLGVVLALWFERS